ncbi:MAG: ABC transporter substrate-binding protein [Actinomycetales bacterium]
MRGLKKVIALLAAALLGVTTLSACGGSSGSTDKVIRIALPSPGEAGQKVWDAAIAKFKAANPEWDVQLIIQDDDIYSTVGLQGLLTGGNPPDAFFEWAGARTAQRLADGYAADLNDLISNSSLKNLFPENAFNSGVVDGKKLLLPTGSDVTNVIWYDVDTFTKLGISVPKTWDEMLAACAKLKAAKEVCFSIGNKDLWVAGNYFGHVYSRVVGEETYHKIMTREIPMNSPELVKAYDVVANLQKNGYINASANSIADNEGYTLFFKGGAATLPIGSWLVSIAADEAPKKKIDWFNLPAFSGGAGDQNSVLGVTTGYVVNAKSAKIDEVIKFFEVFFSDEITAEWVKAGSAPLTKAAASGNLNPLQQRLVDLMTSGGTIVAPPDTGYDLKVADALNVATSEVMGGVKTPQQALDDAEKKLATS